MFAALRMCLRAERRRSTRSWVVLTLLLGLSSGTVLALASGAHRTGTAMPRLLRDHRAAQFIIPNYDFLDFAATFTPEQIRALPNVAEVATARSGIFSKGLWLAPIEGATGVTLNRWKVLEGRTPDPDRADEGVVTFLAAEEQDIAVGDRLPIPGTREELAGFGIEGAPVAWVTITGIVAGPGDFPPMNEDRATVYLTPAFARDVVPQIRRTFAEVEAPLVFGNAPTMSVRLRDPAKADAFRRDMEALAAPKAALMASQFSLDRRVVESIDLQASALWLLAALLALAVSLIMSQVLARHTVLASSENDVRRALGMSRRVLFTMGLLRTVSIAMPAAIIAAAVAVGTSALTPFGLARIAEPQPGFAPNWGIIAMGVFAMIVFVPALTAPTAWRAASPAVRGTGQVSSLSLLSRVRAVLPVAAAAGFGFALQRGRGRSAVPVRSTIAGVLLSLAAVTASLVFARNLDHLLMTPAAYGQTFDLWIANDPEGFPARAHLAELRADPAIESVAIGTPGDGALIDDLEVALFPYDSLGGDQRLIMLSGRAPMGTDEIALGARTLAALGKRVRPDSPDHVTIASGSTRIDAAIVGVVVVPPAGDSAGFGRGAVVHPDLMDRAIPGTGSGGAFVKLAPGADPEALIERLRVSTRTPTLYSQTFEPPADVVNFGRVENLPFILGVILSAIALATLAHTNVSAVRRRGRDLAIYKSLGFVRRQTGGAVLWQSTMLSSIALLLGLPLGIIVGRWIWVGFAGRLGVVSDPQIPGWIIASLMPATLFLGVIVAVLPARRAAFTKPSVMLRSE